MGNAVFTTIGASATRAVAVARDWRQRWAMPLLAVLVVALSLGAWGWWRAPAAATASRRHVIDVPRLTRTGFPVLSPTGERIVFNGDGRLWIRELDDRVARPLEVPKEPWRRSGLPTDTTSPISWATACSAFRRMVGRLPR